MVKQEQVPVCGDSPGDSQLANGPMVNEIGSYLP